MAGVARGRRSRGKMRRAAITPVPVHPSIVATRSPDATAELDPLAAVARVAREPTNPGTSGGRPGVRLSLGSPPLKGGPRSVAPAASRADSFRTSRSRMPLPRSPFGVRARNAVVGPLSTPTIRSTASARDRDRQTPHQGEQQHRTGALRRDRASGLQSRGNGGSVNRDVMTHGFLGRYSTETANAGGPVYRFKPLPP